VVEDFVNIINTLLVLNFGNNFNWAIVLMEYLLDFKYIVFVTNKAVSNEIYIVFNGKLNKRLILFG